MGCNRATANTIDRPAAIGLIRRLTTLCSRGVPAPFSARCRGYAIGTHHAQTGSATVLGQMRRASSADQRLRVFRSCPLITPKAAGSSLQMLAIAGLCLCFAPRSDTFSRAARSRSKSSQPLSRQADRVSAYRRAGLRRPRCAGAMSARNRHPAGRPAARACARDLQAPGNTPGREGVEKWTAQAAAQATQVRFLPVRLAS